MKDEKRIREIDLFIIEDLVMNSPNDAPLELSALNKALISNRLTNRGKEDLFFILENLAYIFRANTQVIRRQAMKHFILDKQTKENTNVEMKSMVMVMPSNVSIVMVNDVLKKYEAVFNSITLTVLNGHIIIPFIDDEKGNNLFHSICRFLINGLVDRTFDSSNIDDVGYLVYDNEIGDKIQKILIPKIVLDDEEVNLDNSKATTQDTIKMKIGTAVVGENVLDNYRVSMDNGTHIRDNSKETR